MIKVYSGFKSWWIIALFLIGFFLLLHIFSWGMSSLVGLLLPALVILSYLLISIFLVVVLPLTLFKTMRWTLGVYARKMSKLLAVTTWLIGFFMLVKALDLIALLFIFSFKLLVPIALLFAMLKGKWHVAEHLALWMGFTYLMKQYSQWALAQLTSRSKTDKVIDVSAVEVIDPKRV